MSRTYTNLIFHVVFSTKDRAKDLNLGVRAELYPYLSGLVRERRGKALAVGGGLDHVHLLASLPPSLDVSALLRFVKANSSRWVRGKFNRHFGWQAGYSAFTVSRSKQSEVAAYIENQEAHHRRQSFEDEYVSLLKRNEIEFDNEIDI